jgi:D-alanyl-D-alanine carboxypeptidase
MALLHELGPDFRFPTFVRSPSPRNAIIYGNLWVYGRGDPSLGSGDYASSLSFGGTRIGHLARKIRSAGVREIRGRIMGVVGYFNHDWFARGWKYDFPRDEVALPSALTINGNVVGHTHIHHPERRAAAMLTRKLIGLGIKVRRRAGAGTPPSGLEKITQVRSRPLWMLLRYMNHRSSNFFAEVLGKRLGLERYGRPGTIAKAARAISAWATAHGGATTAFDASGLSYSNRVTARGIVRLLEVATSSSWGPTLRRILPTGNEGTLEHRLGLVPVRAKTGTLDGISALSGWVWLQALGRWGQFSIMDSGMSKDRAASIEDSIVRTLWRYAK